MPPMRLLSGTTTTDPVGFDVALAGDPAWVQACLVIQDPVPSLHHWVAPFCQDRLTLPLLAAFSSTDSAQVFVTELSSNIRVFSGKRVMPTESFVGTVRTV